MEKEQKTGKKSDQLIMLEILKSKQFNLPSSNDTVK